jgi:hypothetical protein
MLPLAQRTSGASLSDRSTTGRTSGVSLQLDQYIARLALRRGGRCRFSGPVPVARYRPRCHRFTLTRLPVPSVLVPIGTVLTEASWGGPRSVGSVPLLRDPQPDLRLPVCPVASPTRPVRTPKSRPTRPSRSPSPTVTRRLGLTRRLRSCLLRTPTPRCPRLPVPSVLVPIGTVLTEASWGGPRSFGSVPLLRSPQFPVCPVASPLEGLG